MQIHTDSDNLWELILNNIRGAFAMMVISLLRFSDSKVHGANMGPIWVLSAPDGPHVDPINIAIRFVNDSHAHAHLWLSGLPTAKGCLCGHAVYVGK